MLNGRATGGTPMADFIQQRLDAGEDIFGAPEPVSRPDRPAERPDETPEGVDPKVDAVDNAVSEALTMDDGSTLVMVGDEPVDEGFYVMDPATITEYDAEPTTKDITDFLNETEGSDYDGISVWYDEADGRYRMARVGVFDNEQDASRRSGELRHQPVRQHRRRRGDERRARRRPEHARPRRSRTRARRSARSAPPGPARSAARTTAKQKSMLDHVGGTEGADPEIGRITEAVKNGEEITGADASRLADAIDGLGADQFDEAFGQGCREPAGAPAGAGSRGGRRTRLLQPEHRAPAHQRRRDLAERPVPGRRRSAPGGRRTGRRQERRQRGGGREVPRRRPTPSTRSTCPTTRRRERAREHADRLDAMGGVTAPAPEQAPGEPPPPPETPPVPGGEGEGSPVDLLNALFEKIGQPEEYGTEHQGRMLGEARSLAGEGLAEDAAKRLESAASAEPDGSANKQLMLETAAALRGQPAPAAPEAEAETPEGGAPDLAAVTSALGSADEAIDSEVQAEGDNGPQGHTDATDEATNQLGLIRGRVTAEGPYTELSQDLRDLAAAHGGQLDAQRPERRGPGAA